MFKPCPKCGFLVALIAGRETSQRCPRCGSGLVDAEEMAALQARDPSDDDAPPARPAREPAARAPRHGAQENPAVETANPGARAADAVGPGVDVHAQTAAHDEAAMVAPDPTAIEADALPSAARADELPVFARPTRPRAAPAAGPRWPALLAIGVLTLLLALQLVLAQRQELARDGTWRPVVSSVCAVVGCDVPPWREPAAFTMLARNVRPHPSQRGVLRVSTTVRNDARWAQPLPTVVISLSDLEGRIVGSRAVPASEYARTRRAPIAPGASADIAFDVREPAASVVSFDFQLK